MTSKRILDAIKQAIDNFLNECETADAKIHLMALKKMIKEMEKKHGKDLD